jgi:hypothetical protein
MKRLRRVVETLDSPGSVFVEPEDHEPLNPGKAAGVAFSDFH